MLTSVHPGRGEGAGTSSGPMVVLARAGRGWAPGSLQGLRELVENEVETREGCALRDWRRVNVSAVPTTLVGQLAAEQAP